MEPDQPDAAAQPEQQPPQPRYKILVVDDGPAAQRLLFRMLKREGHVVVLAGDGVEGASKFRVEADEERPFDLVISDCDMPKMDGPMMITELLTEFPQMKFFMTGGELHQVVLRELGWQALPKPIEYQALMRRIEEVMKAS